MEAAAPRHALYRWRNRLAASPGWQSWASRFRLTRGIARREGEALFDLVAGFAHSQALLALVELDVLRRLERAPASAEALAPQLGLSPERTRLLLRAGAALGLLRERRDGRFALARRGAVLRGVPGLDAMIRHHGAFYRDMADPVGLLHGRQDTELARFWPYVQGAEGVSPDAAARYSDLMTESQALVSEEVLRTISVRGVRHLMDVGGGSGAFVAAVARRHPRLRFTLVDLPSTRTAAESLLRRAGIADRVRVSGLDARAAPLPGGADAVSLVRVLYDHADETAALLLSRAFDALPPGGRLIVAEPMAGGDRPLRATDVYFAFYTLAMGTGRTRSPEEIVRLCEAAGFVRARLRKTARPFVTGVVTAEKPRDSVNQA